MMRGYTPVLKPDGAIESSPTGASWLPGTEAGELVAGRYRIQRVLGAGSHGYVYEATQEPIGRPVALKVLRADLPLPNRHRVEVRFLREAAEAGRLRHRNVVTVYDYGRTEDGRCYIAMELLRGRTLRQIVAGGGVLDAEQSLIVLEQIARGVRCVHGAGLVHRDIKPGNISIRSGSDGRDHVTLLDFGLVRPVQSENLTDHGLVVGTPRYMAPEQVKNETLDHRTDLYAIGVTMFEALTGRHPYDDARTVMGTALHHVSTPCPSMAERSPQVQVPPQIEAIVRKCMAKAPGDRYQNADALLADVVATRQAMFGRPTGAQPLPPVWVAAIIALLVVVVLGVAALAIAF